MKTQVSRLSLHSDLNLKIIHVVIFYLVRASKTFFFFSLMTLSNDISSDRIIGI